MSQRLQLTRRWRRIGGRFAAARRAAEAVEFALVSLAFITFLMAILNLGDLGFTLSTLQREAQTTARDAAVAAAADVSGNGRQSTCPSAAQIQTMFTTATPAAPLFHPVLTLNSPVWTDHGSTTAPNGTYLSLTASDEWQPIGFPGFAKVDLSVTTVAFAMGAPPC
jgi:hypothetical protein